MHTHAHLNTQVMAEQETPTIVYEGEEDATGDAAGDVPVVGPRERRRSLIEKVGMLCGCCVSHFRTYTLLAVPSRHVRSRGVMLCRMLTGGVLRRRPSPV